MVSVKHKVHDMRLQCVFIARFFTMRPKKPPHHSFGPATLTPFSPGIWYNHRKYCDKVLVKTSQRTSTGLYSVNVLIVSAEQYLYVGIIVYLFPVLNIGFVDVSDQRIDE